MGQSENWSKKSGGDFLSINTFPPKQTPFLLDLSVLYVSKFKSGISSSYKDYQDTFKGDKRKESMWIHHFVILQLFHPKLLKIESTEFLHNNHSSFVRQFTTDKQQEYTNVFEEFPNYNWLWLGQNVSN